MGKQGLEDDNKMPSKNAFLEKQAKIQKACFDEGWDLGVQQMCDYIALALRDPETMGKDTFSGERILKVLRKVDELMRFFRPAFLPVAEADWKQEQLDRALREAFKGVDEPFCPFADRYDCLKQFDYKTGKWKG